MLYKKIEPLTEGDEVQYIGVYVLRWRDVDLSNPVGFVQAKADFEEIQDMVDELISAAKDVAEAYNWGAGVLSAKKREKDARDNLITAVRKLVEG